MNSPRSPAAFLLEASIADFCNDGKVTNAGTIFDFTHCLYGPGMAAQEFQLDAAGAAQSHTHSPYLQDAFKFPVNMAEIFSNKDQGSTEGTGTTVHFRLSQNYRDLSEFQTRTPEACFNFHSKLWTIYSSAELCFETMADKVNDIYSQFWPGTKKASKTMFDGSDDKNTISELRDRLHALLDSAREDARADGTRMLTLLKEMALVIDAMKDVRAKSMKDWKFDPWLWPGRAPNYVLEQLTSDSCQTDDEDGYSFQTLRQDLESFQRDDSRQSYTTKPLYQPRVRKDIRAWARLARYGSMKLSCSSMYIHKDRSKISRRPRKKKREDVGVGAPSRTTFGRTGSESHPRQRTSPDHCPAESNGSGMAGYSTNTRKKKNILIREENGYRCLSPNCSKSFKQVCDLSQHHRNHRAQESLPYGCDTCNMRFLHPEELWRHEKTHRSSASASDDTR